MSEADLARAYIKRRGLMGLATHLAVFGDEEAQNAAIDEAIAAANARARRELRIELATRRIKAWPGDEFTLGVDYDVEEEPYDYFASKYRRFGFLHLRSRPVQSIERVRVMFGPDNEVITYPSAWIRFWKRPGQLSIVPTPGAGWQGIVLQSGQYYLPYISAGWMYDEIPQLIAVDYTVGLGDGAGWGADGSDDLEDLRLQRARLAAGEMLRDLSNSMSPGLSSVSISEDGATESRSYSRGAKTLFAAQVDQIEADWKEFKRSFQETETGINIAFV